MLWFLFFGCSISVDPSNPVKTREIDLETAEGIVLQDVLNNQVEGRLIMELTTPIKTGGVIISGLDSVEYQAKRDAWFFFIDIHPDIIYAKPVQYVFVYCDNGEVEIIDELWWPTIMPNLKRIFWDGISLDRARRILLHNVLDYDTLDRIVMELPYEIEAGTGVWNDFDSTLYEADRDAWFFFIDDFPGWVYTKPVKYVYVYRDNGEYEIIGESWWPNVFGELKRIFWEGMDIVQAEKKLLGDYLNGTLEGKKVYELPVKIPAGGVVRNALNQKEYVAKHDAWFFFVDDTPNAIYAKPVRYFFLYCKHPRESEVFDETWWPDNRDELIEFIP